MTFSIRKHFPAFCLLIAFFLAHFPNLSHAQSMDEGIEYYQQGDFEQALQIFNNIGTPQGRLFAGKSYYSLGQYLTAKTYLNQIDQEAEKEIYLEAEYTTALVDFQLGLYGDALNRLYDTLIDPFTMRSVQ